MKDVTDMPAHKEAEPLFVGGAATKPKGHKLRLVVIIVAVLLVIAGAVAGWWFFLRQDPNYLNISNLKSEDTHILKAQELAKGALPQKAEDQAMYYSLIASYLTVGKEYKYAERYFLTAQKVAEKAKLNQKDYRYYLGLADVYEGMGNKSKAEAYKRKESDFIKANYSAEEVQQMENVKLNGRPR